MSETPAPIPASLRSRIMSRAWEIFRETYNYPRVPFSGIGRACFAWALKRAWSEARDAVDLAARHNAETLKIWIAETRQPAHRVGLSSSYAGSSRDLMERMDRRRRFERALAVAERLPVAA